MLCKPSLLIFCAVLGVTEAARKGRRDGRPQPDLLPRLHTPSNEPRQVKDDVVPPHPSWTVINGETIIPAPPGMTVIPTPTTVNGRRVTAWTTVPAGPVQPTFFPSSSNSPQVSSSPSPTRSSTPTSKNGSTSKPSSNTLQTSKPTSTSKQTSPQVTPTTKSSSTKNTSTKTSKSTPHTKPTNTKSQPTKSSTSKKPTSPTTQRTTHPSNSPSSTSSPTSEVNTAGTKTKASVESSTTSAGAAPVASDDDNSISSTTIAGIVVGVVGGVILAVVVAALLWRRRRDRQLKEKDQVFPESAWLYDPPIPGHTANKLSDDSGADDYHGLVGHAASPPMSGRAGGLTLSHVSEDRDAPPFMTEADLNEPPMAHTRDSYGQPVAMAYGDPTLPQAAPVPAAYGTDPYGNAYNAYGGAPPIPGSPPSPSEYSASRFTSGAGLVSQYGRGWDDESPSMQQRGWSVAPSSPTVPHPGQAIGHRRMLSTDSRASRRSEIEFADPRLVGRSF